MDRQEFPIIQTMINSINDAYFPDNRRTTADWRHMMRDVMMCSERQIDEYEPTRPIHEMSFDPPIGHWGDCYINTVETQDPI